MKNDSDGVVRVESECEVQVWWPMLVRGSLSFSLSESA